MQGFLKYIRIKWEHCADRWSKDRSFVGSTTSEANLDSVDHPDTIAGDSALNLHIFSPFSTSNTATYSTGILDLFCGSSTNFSSNQTTSVSRLTFLASLPRTFDPMTSSRETRGGAGVMRRGCFYSAPSTPRPTRPKWGLIVIRSSVRKKVDYRVYVRITPLRWGGIRRSGSSAGVGYLRLSCSTVCSYSGLEKYTSGPGVPLR
jgi:hypothetical protein